MPGGFFCCANTAGVPGLRWFRKPNWAPHACPQRLFHACCLTPAAPAVLLSSPPPGTDHLAPALLTLDTDTVLNSGNSSRGVAGGRLSTPGSAVLATLLQYVPVGDDAAELALPCPERTSCVTCIHHATTLAVNCSRRQQQCGVFGIHPCMQMLCFAVIVPLDARSRRRVVLLYMI
jgi:hypothetical protein